MLVTVLKSFKIKTEFDLTVDNSFGYRRMVSQFSDIDAPKREGINTFHIQHGLYPNQTLRRQLDSQKSNNIFDMNPNQKV